MQIYDFFDTKEVNFINKRTGLELCASLDLEIRLKSEFKQLFNSRRAFYEQANSIVDGLATITLKLHPDLVESIPAYALSDDISLGDYLGDTQSDFGDRDKSQITNSESWFCLSICQAVSGDLVKVRDIWDYVHTEDFSQNTQDLERIGKSFEAFSLDYTHQVLSHGIKDQFETLKDSITRLDNLDNMESSDFKARNKEDSITHKVSDFLIERGWGFEKFDKNNIFSINISGRNGSWKFYIVVRQLEQQIICYSRAFTQVTEDRKIEALDFLNRANYDMLIGNFELNYKTGEVRYKTSLEVEPSQVDNNLLANLVDVNLHMMDAYIPGINAVIEGTQTPEDAIALVESDLEDDDDTNGTAESN